jgi:hypothetical protein
MNKGKMPPPEMLQALSQSIDHSFANTLGLIRNSARSFFEMDDASMCKVQLTLDLEPERFQAIAQSIAAGKTSPAATSDQQMLAHYAAHLVSRAALTQLVHNWGTALQLAPDALKFQETFTDRDDKIIGYGKMGAEVVAKQFLPADKDVIFTRTQYHAAIAACGYCYSYEFLRDFHENPVSKQLAKSQLLNADLCTMEIEEGKVLCSEIVFGGLGRTRVIRIEAKKDANENMRLCLVDSSGLAQCSVKLLRLQNMAQIEPDVREALGLAFSETRDFLAQAVTEMGNKPIIGVTYCPAGIETDKKAEEAASLMRLAKSAQEYQASK